jgi:UDP-glucose 4-epimerase
MNFLITGAAGFLGSTLANQLAREGHQVRGIDDLSTGDPQVLAPDVHFTRGDVNDRPKLWTVNVGGTVALMEAIRDVGIKRVVLASSGAVYGDLGDQPLTEPVTPNPRSPYAVSKLAAEYYVRTIGGLWGIETVSLRIFNAYGPGQHLPASHPPVVPHYLRQAQRGGTLVAHGDGSQTRDYVYVDDVVSAMVAAATAPNVNGLVINIGSGNEISIRDLVRLVLDVTVSKANVVYNAQISGGVSRMRADLKLAQEKLRFQPSIKLEDGLRLTLQRDSRFK